MSAPGPAGPTRGDGLNIRQPNIARMYDYLLGGKDHSKADRAAAEEILKRVPTARVAAAANRAFTGRVVRHLIREYGIRQFIDIGSGLPTSQNVHEVAQDIAADSRVVYVDNDRLVLAHARALLATNENTTVVDGDLRDPDSILKDPALTDLIDHNRPVAVLVIAILHFIPDDTKPEHILRAYRDWMPPGSFLAVSHIDRTPEVEDAARVYDQAISPATPRTRDQVEAFFGDFELIEPGLVSLPAWRPDDRVVRQLSVPLWGGVARKSPEGGGADE